MAVDGKISNDVPATVGAGAVFPGVQGGTNKKFAASLFALKEDTSTSGMGFVIDEDSMASDSATKVPTQQSVKAYASNPANHSYTQGVSGDTTRTVLEFIREGRTNVHDLTVPSDGSSATAGLKRAFERGGALWVPEGTYNIPPENTTDGGVIATLTKSLDILCHPNAKFVAGENLQANPLRFTVPSGGTGLPSEGIIFKWEGGRIDVSLACNPTSVLWTAFYDRYRPGGTGSRAALSPYGAFESGGNIYSGIKLAHIVDVDFYAGDHWITAGGDNLYGAGEGIDNSIVERCRFRGSRGTAIYGLPAWTSSSPPYKSAGGKIIIRDCVFDACAGGMSLKQSVDQFLIENNLVRNSPSAYGIAGSGIHDLGSGGVIRNNRAEYVTRLLGIQNARGITAYNNTLANAGALDDEGNAITILMGAGPTATICVFEGMQHSTIEKTIFLGESTEHSATTWKMYYLGHYAHTDTTTYPSGYVKSTNNVLRGGRATEDMTDLGSEASGQAEYNTFIDNKIVGGSSLLTATDTTSETVIKVIRDGRINVHDLGVPSDGTSNASAKLKAAFERGGSLWVPEGVYNIPAESVTLGGVSASLTKSLDVLCHPNAKFVAGSLFKNTNLIYFSVPSGGVGLPNELVSIFWEGGLFDSSNILNPTSIPWSGTYPPATSGATGSNTVFSPYGGFTSGSVNYCGFKRVVLRKARFTAGTHWITAGGDSMVGAGEGVEMMVIEENEFVASRDTAIYGLVAFEGDANGQAGGPIIVRKNRFINCAGGASLKRSVPSPIIEGNYAENCVSAFGFSGSADDDPSQGGVIRDNLMKGCIRAIDMQLANGARIENNTIIDYGAVEDDGTTPITAIYSGYPIVLLGSQYCIVRGNRYRNKSSAWSAQSVSFFDFGNAVHNVLGTLKTSYCTVEDNVAEADMVDLGREQSGECEHNTYRANRIVGGASLLSAMDTTSKVIPPSAGMSMTYLDTSSSAHTGTTSKTLVKSRTITPTQMPQGEGFELYCAGTVTGTNGTKLIQLHYGGLNLTASSQGAGDEQTWYFRAVFRRATSTGWSIDMSYTEDGGTKGTESDYHGLGTSTWDVGVDVTLGSALDTVTVLILRVSPLP